MAVRLSKRVHRCFHPRNSRLGRIRQQGRILHLNLEQNELGFLQRPAIEKTESRATRLPQEPAKGNSIETHRRNKYPIIQSSRPKLPIRTDDPACKTTSTSSSPSLFFFYVTVDACYYEYREIIVIGNR